MRNTILRVGLSSFALILVSSGQVGAISTENMAITDSPINFGFSNEVSTTEDTKKEDQPKASKELPKPEVVPVVVATPPPPTTYTVVAGDTLTKIATSHQTTWTRLFAKNPEIANPDSINVSTVITIPETSEQLAERAIPVTAPQPIAQAYTASATRKVTNTAQAGTQTRTSSAGNTYTAGYCTWYAKSRRPDLPNRLGNANTWVSRAAAQGFSTGSAPRAGAIGQQGMHVVYVESVNGDGTVTVSEMNYRGLYVTSSRTVPASNFTYIY